MQKTRLILVLAAGLLYSLAPAMGNTNLPTNPFYDPDFLILKSGQDLRNIVVKRKPLSLVFGTGLIFTEAQQTAYKKLKRQTLTDRNSKVQWAIMDLDNHQVLQKSLGADRKIFGASSSKIFVAGALLEKQRGKITEKQLQQLGDMIAISSNVAWVALQNQVGDGDDDRGRAAVHAFTQKMGYEKTRGFQGTFKKNTPEQVHGNEMTAAETVQFLYDTYWNRYPGAEILWKFMHTCRTGVNRALKYLPIDQVVGGKTGTYRGASVDPDTGLELNSDGTRYRVHVRNHEIVFNLGGRQYALVVLADTGSDESAALLAGGLYREYSK